MPTLGTANMTVGGVTYTIDLDITAIGDSIEVTYESSRGNDPSVTGTIVLNPNSNNKALSTFMFQPAILQVSPNAIPLAACIAGCVAASLVPPILDCLYENWNTPQNIADCVKRRAPGIAAEALFCIYECFQKFPLN